GGPRGPRRTDRERSAGRLRRARRSRRAVLRGLVDGARVRRPPHRRPGDGKIESRIDRRRGGQAPSRSGASRAVAQAAPLMRLGGARPRAFAAGAVGSRHDWSARMKDFAGKVAVITGAGSGFGLEFARLGAREGMRLFLADVQQDALDAAVADARSRGAEAVGVRADVSKAEDVDRAAAQAKSAFGAVHLLFNNAGVAGGGG